ncbi:MAG: nucleotidyl transferase AbiEii/AbiGii toxin family protein [Bacilli bacterium]|nr:nucleotidyl transferase AbiEii/AbiGii toxin family protein [Bacilli bacterium]
MKNLNQIIIENVKKGMTRLQAENYAAQSIILSKIANSTMKDKILLKGGVVMFNITKNLRRTTMDLDFDLVRYDISDQSIKSFVALLNKTKPLFNIELISSKPLKHQDYKGKRVVVQISDAEDSILFKMDIGVHTLFGIEQSTTVFYFEENNEIILKINPPEQMVAEKLLSLGKIGPLSERYKDIYDIYYFINKRLLNKKKVTQCINLLLIDSPYDIATTNDLINRVEEVLLDDDFKEKAKNSKAKWIDESFDIVTNTIINYIHKL